VQLFVVPLNDRVARLALGAGTAIIHLQLGHSLYVAGGTASQNFPTTANAFPRPYGGGLREDRGDLKESS
jgi:hypothetical protein